MLLIVLAWYMIHDIYWIYSLNDNEIQDITPLGVALQKNKMLKDLRWVCMCIIINWCFGLHYDIIILLWMCSLNGNKIQDIGPLGVGLEENNSLVELQ